MTSTTPSRGGLLLPKAVSYECARKPQYPPSATDPISGVVYVAARSHTPGLLLFAVCSCLMTVVGWLLAGLLGLGGGGWGGVLNNLPSYLVAAAVPTPLLTASQHQC